MRKDEVSGSLFDAPKEEPRDVRTRLHDPLCPPKISIEPHTHARSDDPATSKQAAHTLEFAAKQALMICEALTHIGCGTVYEISDALRGELLPHQLHKRCADAHEAGLIRVQQIDGVDVTRKGPTGRPCRVWELSPKAGS